MVLREKKQAKKKTKALGGVEYADMTLVTLENEMEKRHDMNQERNRVQYKYIHKSN